MLGQSLSGQFYFQPWLLHLENITTCHFNYGDFPKQAGPSLGLFHTQNNKLNYGDFLQQASLSQGLSQVWNNVK